MVIRRRSINQMELAEASVPPGFRFHPTEEELVGYYLKRKINCLKIDLDVIIDIDLYKIEPWDIQARCNLGYSEQNEWYFFSHKDRKYPTGTRTNRATAAGFWKATGRDKAVVSKNKIIGMRKTLVFYKGRAPNGRKSDWIMHEYRLQSSENAPPQEEGWVVCRAFKKPTPNPRQGYEPWNNHAYYMRENYTNQFRQQFSSNDILSTPTHIPQSNLTPNFTPFGSDRIGSTSFDNQIIHELPQLDSPSLSTSFATQEVQQNFINEDFEEEKSNQFIDWKNIDHLLAYPNIEAQDHQGHNFSHILGCLNE